MDRSHDETRSIKTPRIHGELTKHGVFSVERIASYSH
jgi:hypothetical protein